ncbi:MAG: cupin domain-containing protein, partial [Deferrisomatales bacterium]|nr:cupin domain-containing protein [Deferrisomatales bacterium]
YHWVVPDEPSRWEWEEGDSVYIPPNTVHQHFNLDADKPVRFLSAESRTLKLMGLDDLEQLEDAPEYSSK